MYLYIQNFPRHLIKHSAGYTLRENIRFHSFAFAKFQFDLAIFNSVRDKEMLDVEVSGSLGGCMALLRKGDGAGVVMQDSGRPYLVS